MSKRHMNNRGDKLTQLFRRNGDGTKKISARNESRKAQTDTAAPVVEAIGPNLMSENFTVASA